MDINFFISSIIIFEEYKKEHYDYICNLNVYQKNKINQILFDMNNELITNYNIYYNKYNNEYYINEIKKIEFKNKLDEYDEDIIINNISGNIRLIIYDNIEFSNILNNNIDKNYIFYPVHLIDKNQDFTHIDYLIINNVLEEIYLLDTCGKNNYFIDINDNNKIDDLFIKYISDLNKNTILQYKFISSKNWNPNNLILNREINNKNYYGGHCVILSILTCHYLYLSNKTLFDIYSELSNLCDDELLNLIHNYSNSIYSIITEN